MKESLMSKSDSADSLSRTIELPAALTLCAAAPLATELLEARGRALMVDASKVETVGAQCLQLLLSARATWERDNSILGMVNPSKALLDALDTLGIPIGKIGELEPVK